MHNIKITMDYFIKKKIKITAIIFFIIIGPLGFFFKNMIAKDIHDTAYFGIHTEPHYGKSLEDVKYEAIAKIDKAINLNKREHIFHYTKGKLYFELEDYDYALESVEHALKIKPDFLSALNLKATLLEFLDSEISAIREYEKIYNLIHNQNTNYQNNMNLHLDLFMYKYLIDKDKDWIMEKFDSLGKLESIDKLKLDYYESFVNYCHIDSLSIKKLNHDKIWITHEPEIEKDSLENILLDNGIFWEGYTLFENHEYEINEVFKEKAIELGFKMK